MKLAEALALRADITKRIDQLRGRLCSSVLVQEGEDPPEDPKVLLQELDDMLNQLQDLITRINRTNLQTKFQNDKTITEVLAERDVLLLRRNVIQATADAASRKNERYSRTEIRMVTTVDISALRKEQDALARRHREFDTSIQAANWNTDLLE